MCFIYKNMVVCNKGETNMGGNRGTKNGGEEKIGQASNLNSSLEKPQPTLLLPIPARQNQKYFVTRCKGDIKSDQNDYSGPLAYLVHPSQASTAIISSNQGSSCSQTISYLESSPSFTNTPFGENDVHDITSLYSFGRLVGVGSQSFVYTCSINGDATKREPPTKSDLCIKHIVTDVSIGAIRAVCNIKHPNVAGHLSAHCDWRGLWVVMEYIDGRDLASYITDTNFRRTDVFCRNIYIQMMQAIACVHERNLIHRDIKLENFVVREFEEKQSEFPRVALVDFGLAELKGLNKQPKRRSPVGTLMYMAPEVLLDAAADEKSDIWSAGILLSILLVGHSPFGEKNVVSLLDRQFDESAFCDIGLADSIESRFGHFANSETAAARMLTNFINCPSWLDISEDAKNLITRMLNLDPKKRPSANEVLRSAWLQNGDTGNH